MTITTSSATTTPIAAKVPSLPPLDGEVADGPGFGGAVDSPGTMDLTGSINGGSPGEVVTMVGGSSVTAGGVGEGATAGGVGEGATAGGVDEGAAAGGVGEGATAGGVGEGATAGGVGEGATAGGVGEGAVVVEGTVK